MVISHDRPSRKNIKNHESGLVLVNFLTLNQKLYMLCHANAFFGGIISTFIMNSKRVLHLDILRARATMNRSRSANGSCIVCAILLSLLLSNDDSET